MNNSVYQFPIDTCQTAVISELRSSMQLTLLIKINLKSIQTVIVIIVTSIHTIQLMSKRNVSLLLE